MPRAVTVPELRTVLTAEREGAEFLLYRGGDGELAVLPLAAAPSRLVIGRHATCDLALTWDAVVSGAHAELQRIGPDWTVVDDGLSRNGTFVSGERVIGRRRLHDGDAIRIGRTVIVYRAPLSRAATGQTLTAAQPLRPPALTEHQRLLLIALCRPLRDQHDAFVTPATNQQIAAELHLSVHAVKAQLRTLFQLFGLGHEPQNVKRVRLAENALRSGIISQRELTLDA